MNKYGVIFLKRLDPIIYLVTSPYFIHAVNH